MASDRENADFHKRLIEIGRKDLLARIASGQIKLYEAMMIAGLCESNSIDCGAALTKNWNRLSGIEKRKFASKHLGELALLVDELHAEKTKQIEE
jgi:hypothetical protein